MKTKEQIEERVAYLRDLTRRDRALRDRCVNQSEWHTVNRRMVTRIRQQEALQWVLDPEA